MWNLRRIRVLAFALFECGVLIAVPAMDAVLEVRSAEAHVEGYGRCSPSHNHLSSEHSETQCQFARALFMGVVHLHTLPHLRPVTEWRPVPPAGNPLRSGPVVAGGLGPRPPPLV